MHDATAARIEGIETCLQHIPDVEVLLGDGYLGRRRDCPGQEFLPDTYPAIAGLVPDRTADA